MENDRALIKPVFVKILREWRKVFIICIGIGILMGGVRLLTGILSWNNNMEQFEADLLVYNQDLEASEENLASLEKNYDENVEKVNQQETYLENSILMNMDPEQKNEVSADVWINLDDSTWSGRYSNTNADPTDTLIDLYNTYINHQMDWSKISATTGIREEYIGELVEIVRRMDSNIITIRVSHPDTTVARTILDGILTEMENYRGQLTAIVGEYSIVTANIITETVSDEKLLNKQAEQEDLLSSYNQAVTDTQNLIDEISWPTWPTSEPSRKEICISAILFGAIGFLIGVMLISFICYIKYRFDGKAHSDEELENLFNIPCLGVMMQKEDSKNEKRRFIFIDKQIEKLIGEKTRIKEQTIYQMLALNIKNHSDNIKSLLLIGDVNEQSIEKFRKVLSDLLPEKKFEIVGDADICQKTMECEGILLIEKLEHSKIDKIQDEKLLAESLDKKLIGFILV